MTSDNLEKAAQRGNPSFIWREGQKRRLNLITTAASKGLHGNLLVNGCGVGMYVKHLTPIAGSVTALDIEFERVLQTKAYTSRAVNAVGERLPFPQAYFDIILSHEVLEHVTDDQKVINEMVRTLKVGGRIILFCPNRGYPFETHGVYWRGKYHFGNIPLVNYLPLKIRNKLAPHVKIYTRHDLNILFKDLPVKIIQRKTIFGAYDNIIKRSPKLGRFLRTVLQKLEGSFLQVFGLSHFWIIEKI
jgi:SAM-dependent methyltransferase